MDTRLLAALGIFVQLLILPWYLVKFSFNTLRPNHRWTYAQAVKVHLARVIVQYVSLKRPLARLTMEGGREENRFEAVKPGQSNIYVEICAIDSKIKPGVVGGTWTPRKPDRSNGQARGTVAIHFHGGAYVLGDGRDGDAGFAASSFLKAGAGKLDYVICPQYRLAGRDEHRFPAQLQDAITWYAHLVRNAGFDESRIVVSGDSAGANLGAALVRYLELHGSKIGLEPPTYLWMWSPWVDAVSSLQDNGQHDASKRAHTDYTTGSLGSWGARSFAPAKSTGIGLDNEFIQLLGNPFSTSSRVFLSAGSNEVFLDGILLFSAQMNSVAGNRINCHIIEDAPHDVILMGDKIGFAQHARRGVAEAMKLMITSKDAV